MVNVPVKQLWGMKSVGSVRYLKLKTIFSLLLILLDVRMVSLVSLPTNCLDVRTVTVTWVGLSISWALCLTVTRRVDSACARTGCRGGPVTR